jgi:hypothetical protein
VVAGWHASTSRCTLAVATTGFGDILTQQERNDTHNSEGGLRGPLVSQQAPGSSLPYEAMMPRQAIPAEAFFCKLGIANRKSAMP